MMTPNYTKRLLALMALANTVLCFAQDFTFKKYDWEKPDTKIIIPEQYTNEKEVILNRTLKAEILVENNKAVQYRLLHQQTYINSDEAIEKNNRIYINISQDEKILDNKVRVILKNNKVITLDKNDIKEEIDEERKSEE